MLIKCPNCGAEFKIFPCLYHPERCCSTKCRYELRVKSGEERFWKRVLITSDKEDCWLWYKPIGAKCRYPSVGINMIQVHPIYAHRAAFFFHYGYLPANGMVCHRCGVNCCCNPFHLYDGTAKTNYDDMVRHRGKPIGYSGESSPMAKLTLEQVKMIKQVYPTLTKRGQKSELARSLNVCQKTLCQIMRGERWRNAV